MRTISLLLLLAACKKDETDPTDDTVDSTDTTDTTDTTSTTDTTDTPGGPTGIIPTAALMEIGIAYDPATDSAVGFTDEAGVAQMPYVRLALGSARWNGEWSDTGDYCTFQITAAGPLTRAADLPADVVFGTQFAAGTAYTSDCNELVDDRIGDIEAQLSAVDYGFAWLPTIFPDFGRELVRNGQLTVEDLERFIGGGITGRFAAPDPLLPTALTSGYVTDDTFHIQVDDVGDGVRRTRTEMVVNDALTKGVYRMQLFIPADQVLSALTP